MGYCCRCGTYAALDDDKTCAVCRLSWRPAAVAPDLGTRSPRHPGDP
jgi:hypothetical protein